jgi:FemAB-related protein (PEP-CTERM system-associated)
VSIRDFQPCDRARWDDFVANQQSSHACHLAGWASVIEQGCGQRPHYLLSESPGGEIDGVLPLARVRSLLFGDFLVSLPYLNYGGPCAPDPAVSKALVDTAVAMARRERVKYLELRLGRDGDFGLRVKSSKVAMCLALPENADTLWRSFTSKLRNKIQRPMRDGMAARMGAEDELDSFYHVFAINMRDLGTPVYSKGFFAAVLREFPGTARICTIYRDKAPVASGLVVGFKETLEVPWASSLRSLNASRPNTLLYWNLLKYACDAGYRVFDFGRSTPEGGTFQFKEQWGAKPQPLRWHYWMPNDGPLPELNPSNPKYRLSISVWKRLPVPLTRLIGPSIVRNIP